jgi:hypothetical protein
MAVILTETKEKLEQALSALSAFKNDLPDFTEKEIGDINILLGLSLDVVLSKVAEVVSCLMENNPGLSEEQKAKTSLDVKEIFERMKEESEEAETETSLSIALKDICKEIRGEEFSFSMDRIPGDVIPKNTEIKNMESAIREISKEVLFQFGHTVMDIHDTIKLAKIVEYEIKRVENNK